MTRSFPFVGTLIHEKINVTVTLISKTGNSTLEHPVVTHKPDIVRHLTYHGEEGWVDGLQHLELNYAMLVEQQSIKKAGKRVRRGVARVNRT